MTGLLAPIPSPGWRSSLRSDDTSYALTAGIVNVIWPMLRTYGLRLGALLEVNHFARGTKADLVLLELAKRKNVPVVTNEGFTRDGVIDSGLRKRCRNAGVRVYSTVEYLQSLGVDTALAARHFLKACEPAIVHAYVEAELSPRAWRHVIEDIYPLYRLILLGETRTGILNFPVS